MIVGVSGAESLNAVELAADEAAARVTPLVVLQAIEESDVAEDAEWLVNAVARARAEHPGLSVSAERVPGPVVEALGARAQGACLIVVGHDKTGHDTTVRLGRAARVPVVVHRPLAPAHEVELPRPVLVGVAACADLDPLLGFAFESAWLRGAPVLAMHVHDEARPDTDARLDEAVTTWSQEYPEVLVRRTVRLGSDVAAGLAAASQSAQLLVVGLCRTHEAGDSGSVTDSVLHRAGCPVAVVGAAA